MTTDSSDPNKYWLYFILFYTNRFVQLNAINYAIKRN